MIIVIVFFAMAIPIACVVLGAQSYFQKPTPPIDPAAFAPLHKSLEDIADKSFESKTNLSPDHLVNLTATRLDEAQKKVEERASALGGIALRSESQSGADEIHLLVQMPENQVKTFTSAPMGAKPGESMPAQGDDQARTLIDVVIKKQAE